MFTPMDAVMLSAAAGTWASRRSADIQHFIDNCAWDGEIPSFDQASFGLARLVAAGYVRVTKTPTRIRVQATDRGRKLKQASNRRSKHRGDPPTYVAEALGAKRWPESEVDEPWAGRLKGLERADWDAAVAAYRASFDRDMKWVYTISAVMHRLFKFLRPDDYR